MNKFHAKSITIDGESSTCCPECLAREGRIEELEETVRQLRADLFNTEWEPPHDLRLKRMELDIIRALLRSGDRPLSDEFLIQATRSRPSMKDHPENKVIHTVICKMRPKLRDYGVEIETVWGRGFRLTAASRRRLLNWNTEAKAA